MVGAKVERVATGDFFGKLMLVRRTLDTVLLLGFGSMYEFNVHTYKITPLHPVQLKCDSLCLI